MLRLILKIICLPVNTRGRALAAAALLTLGAAAVQPARAQGEGDLRRAVALLDYVAGDYPQAVGPHGVLLSATEHEEQIGFVKDAAREVQNGSGAAGADLVARLSRLAAEVEAKGEPAEVSQQARALRDEIAQRFRVAILPASPPQLARGAALYAQSCAACHGADGHPPAQEVLQLSTQPPAFASPAEVAQLSPQRAFAATTYGVPKTAMPAFDDAYDDAARWDLAFYVLSLAHPAADAARGLRLAQAALLPTGYRELAVQNDAALATQLARTGLTEADRAEALAALRAGPFADERASGRGLAQVRRDLQGVLALAERGDREGARRAVISAYLDHLEPSEPSLRARDPGLVDNIEAGFLALRQALDARGDDRARAALPAAGAAGPGAGSSGSGGASGTGPGNAGPAGPGAASGSASAAAAPPASSAPSVAAAVAQLDRLLEKGDTAPSGGGLVAFLAALAIALREGVEAALLVALLLALLRKSNRAADARAVHFGWVVALVAGAGTWWASGALLHLPGASRELTEGTLQLVTAALLLYASHWVLAASSAKKLVGFISAKTLASGSAVVIFWLAFGAVYREMFEVVIFFRGLLFETPGGGPFVLGGALLGLALLALLVFVFQGLGKKLKPRPLLLTCGVMLCGLAVLMVGNGVHALQEAGVVPLTVWGAFQLPSLGVYPTREGLLGQALVLAALIGSAAWTFIRGASAGSAQGPTGSDSKAQKGAPAAVLRT